MKFRPLLLILAALALFAAACGSDDPVAAATDAVADAVDDVAEAADDAMQDDAMEDEDHSDDTMEDEEAMADDAMADAPQRIVSLSPTGTEMLFAIGAGDQVVAVDNFSYYPPEAPVIDDLSAWTPSVEAIAGFEPDLIVSSGPIEGIEALAVETLVLPAAVTFDDVYSQIEQLGATTGHVGEAAELVLQMQTDIDAVIADLPARDAPLTY